MKETIPIIMYKARTEPVPSSFEIALVSANRTIASARMLKEVIRVTPTCIPWKRSESAN